MGRLKRTAGEREKLCLRGTQHFRGSNFTLLGMELLGEKQFARSTSARGGRNLFFLCRFYAVTEL